MRALKRRLLLLHPDLEPQLDEDDAGIDSEFLDQRAQFEETLVFGRRAEAHDIFDAGAVVPAAVEDHDLAAGRKLLDIALQEQLGFLAVGRRGQGADTENPRAHLFGKGLDGAALAGGVASLEQDDHLQLLGLDPFLQMAKLDLELFQLLLVVLALHLLRGLVFCHADPFAAQGPERNRTQSPQEMVMPISPGTPPGKSMI